MEFQVNSARAVFMLCHLLLAAEVGADAAVSSTSDQAAVKVGVGPMPGVALFDVVPDARQVGRIAARENLEMPNSMDALFGLEPGAEQTELDRPGGVDAVGKSASVFTEAHSAEAGKGTTNAYSATAIRGYFQAEMARTYASPEHWSKAMGRLELGSQGHLGQGVKWKLSGRFDYNAIYDLTDFYQPAIRDDQRAEFNLRETYLDFPLGTWDWRVGRQHVVWGEMVGLFFADVVSAKDMREFVLPDFEVLRIPQWAARAEYFKDDFHVEAVYIPFPSFDEIGKPGNFLSPGSGAAFYPYPPSVLPVINNEVRPGTSLNHGNFGVRLSQLTQGWDFSGFLYSSMNSAPTFYRTGVNVFTPRHDRIWQAGGTMAKDFRNFVIKAEAVYSDGRRYNLRTNLTDPDGVVVQNTLDWVLGLDFNPGSDTRVNAQLFQRYFFNHDADIVPERAENGMSFMVSHKLSGNWDADALLVRSLNRDDWMLRPRLAWGFQPDWKLRLGLDVFHGPPDGLFGQYNNQDRGYVEIRHDF